MRNNIKSGQRDVITDIMFYVCLCLTIALALIVLFLNINHLTFLDIVTKPCVVLSHTGIYCPGCGFTHAMTYLVSGRIVESFLSHPAVLIGAVMNLVFIGSHIISLVSKGKIKGLRFRLIYLYSLLAVIMMQCLIKNIL